MTKTRAAATLIAAIVIAALIVASAPAADDGELPGRKLENPPYLTIKRAKQEARAQALDMLDPFNATNRRTTARIMWCHRRDDINVDCKVAASGGGTTVTFVDELQLHGATDECYWSGRQLRVISR